MTRSPSGCRERMPPNSKRVMGPGLLLLFIVGDIPAPASMP